MRTDELSDMDPSYPRTYTAGPGWKIFSTLIGLVFILPSAAMLLRYADTGASRDLPGAIFGIFLILMGLYLMGTALVARITLTADAIEIAGVLGTRRLSREDIKGRRNPQGRGQTRDSTWLIPKETSARRVLISGMIKRDAVLNRWISSLSDLDRAENEELKRAILNDDTAGATQEERLAALATAKKVGRIFTGIAFVIGFGSVVVPPNGLLISATAALPWIVMGLAARSPNLYTLNDRRNDPRGGLGGAFMLPGFMLMILCLKNYHLVSFSSVHAAALALVALMSFLAAKVDAQLIRKKTIFIVLPLLLPYAYSTLILANALPDTSPAKSYAARVISKRYTSGRGSHPELTIAPWGPDSGGSIEVSGAVYKAVQPGDNVCAYLRDGALGIAWYQIDLCH